MNSLTMERQAKNCSGSAGLSLDFSLSLLCFIHLLKIAWPPSWGVMLSYPLSFAPSIFQHKTYKKNNGFKADIKSLNKNQEAYPPTSSSSLGIRSSPVEVERLLLAAVLMEDVTLLFWEVEKMTTKCLLLKHYCFVSFVLFILRAYCCITQLQGGCPFLMIYPKTPEKKQDQ